MKRFGLFLVAFALVGVVGCGGGGGGGTPDVQSGGDIKMGYYAKDGYTINPWFEITGSVVNIGDGDAERVEIRLWVESNGSEVCSMTPLLGTVAAGERKELNYTLINCPEGLKVSSLGFRHSITWEGKE